MSFCAFKFLNIKLMLVFACFLRLVYILLLVFCKFLEADRQFTLKIGYNVCDSIVLDSVVGALFLLTTWRCVPSFQLAVCSCN